MFLSIFLFNLELYCPFYLIGGWLLQDDLFLRRLFNFVDIFLLDFILCCYGWLDFIAFFILYYLAIFIYIVRLSISKSIRLIFNLYSCHRICFKLYLIFLLLCLQYYFPCLRILNLLFNMKGGFFTTLVLFFHALRICSKAYLIIF